MMRYFYLLLLAFLLNSQSVSAADAPTPSFQRDHGEPLKWTNPHDIIAVRLMHFEINRLTSPDMIIGKNEGAVSIEFGNGENAVQTQLFWSGSLCGSHHLSFLYNRDGPDPDNSSDTINQKGILLYFGEIDRLGLTPGFAPNLQFHASVVEDDRGDDEKWQLAADIIKKMGQAAGAIPKYGAAAAAGGELLGDVVGFWSKLIHRSTTELDYTGDFLNPHLPNGANPSDVCGNYTLTSGGTADIILHFKLENLQAIPAPVPHNNPNVRIFLEKLHIPQDVANKIAGWHLVPGMVSRGTVYFEVKVHSDDDKGPINIKRSDHPNVLKEGGFGFQDVLIYEGLWQNAGIPVSISLVYTQEIEKFQDLVLDTSKLTKEVIPLLYPSANKAVNKAVNKADDKAAVPGTLQTDSSMAFATAKPESRQSLFSLGIDLIREERQTMLFPVYSITKNRCLGNIIAHTRIAPVPQVKSDSEEVIITE